MSNMFGSPSEMLSRSNQFIPSDVRIGGSSWSGLDQVPRHVAFDGMVFFCTESLKKGSKGSRRVEFDVRVIDA